MNFVMPLGKKVGAVPMTLAFGFTLAVAWGLRNGWKLTFGGVFEWLADKSVLTKHPFSFLHTINTKIINALAKMEGWAELHFVKMLVYIGEYLAVMAGTVYLLGWAFYKAQKAAWAAIDKLGAAAASKVSTAVVTLIRKIVGAAIAVERKVWQRSFNRVQAQVTTLKHHASVRVHPGFESGAWADALPRVPANARVARLEHDVKGIAKTLARYKWLLAFAGMTAFGRAFFRHFRLGWLRCNNVGRVGRGLCGLPSSLVTSLFADALEAMLITDLCRMAVLIQGIARKITPSLGVFLLVQDAVCLSGGASLPSAHDSPRVTTKITLPSAHD